MAISNSTPDNEHKKFVESTVPGQPGVVVVNPDGSSIAGGGGGAGTEYTEDAAAAADPKGMVTILVRKDTPAAAVSADGDNIAQRGTNFGAAYVTILDAAGNAVAIGGGTQYTEDAAAVADPVGNVLNLIRADTPSAVTSADGDNVAARGTNLGEQYVFINPGALSVAKVEDAAAASGDVGIPAFTVRRDTAASSAGSDGDYATLNTDNTGRLWVNVGAFTASSITPGTGAGNLGKAEDAAHSSGDTGVMGLAVSDENLTAFGAASGDYTPHAVNRYGQAYVTSPPPSHASSNGTPITATTTSVVAAPSAGNHLRVTRVHISNGGATATWVAVRDGAAGTQHYRTYLPQGGCISLNLNQSGPLDLTTATRLDIVLSAAGSVEYEIDYLTVAD